MCCLIGASANAQPKKSRKPIAKKVIVKRIDRQDTSSRLVMEYSSQPIIEVQKPPEIRNTSLQDDFPFRQVEFPAAFRGGDIALQEFIQRNLEYPKKMLEDGISGVVQVEFIVNKDGSLRDCRIIKSLCMDADKEAMRLVKSMPKFLPGKQNGYAVPSYFTLPLTFTLDDE